MSELWPPRPTHHDRESNISVNKPRWLDPHQSGQYMYDFRKCSHCGSIHPGDLLKACRATSLKIMSGCDWKYGYPHKFYVHLPNPMAGQITEVSRTYANGTSTPTMGPASSMIQAKWYNDHLLDEGYDPDKLQEFLDELCRQTQILFFFEDGKLKYSAPYAGYQAIDDYMKNRMLRD